MLRREIWSDKQAQADYGRQEHGQIDENVRVHFPALEGECAYASGILRRIPKTLVELEDLVGASEVDVFEEAVCRDVRPGEGAAESE